MSAAARPLVSVYGSSTPIVMPAVLLAPIRADLVHSVHTNMAKNHRQPYAVSGKAGMQHSAESWGTGRAVSRIPRVSGSGTHRAGQGAFGNMCRKGRMFAPTKTYRRWHRKISTGQRRYAVASALAASAIPSLVIARGHRVMQMKEIPAVVAGIESVSKTAKAVELLKSIGAYVDVEKSKDSKQIRTGKGKMRNRRYTLRRGPLVVYNKDEGVTRAFRNLPGVDIQQVDRLNLLELAPGGHLGRFIIWSEEAFKRLDDIFGTQKKMSQTRSNWRLPRPMVTNTDISRIINSSEVQAVVRPVQRQKRVWTMKKNPLKNLGAMVKLNPYALTMKRNEIKTSNANKEAKAAGVKTAAQKKVAAIKKKKDSIKKKFYNNVLIGA